jgi:DNA-binding LacI/PurR family transcriptional regulator
MGSFDLMVPPVTSVLLPSNEIGDRAVELLLRNMKEPGYGYEKVSLETELIVRKSCGTK